MRVLLTGATGYIASHVWVELIERGYDTVGIDNFDNSSPVVLDRITELCGTRPDFVEGDVRDRKALDKAMTPPPDAVIHFAGLKAVGESVAEPLRYYDVNLGSSITLLQAMGDAGVNHLVFSSSCTVYDDPDGVVDESMGYGPINPYGRTKRMIEEIIEDYGVANPDFAAFLLRYFNPVGAHSSGRIGEDPSGVPNNLMPFVMQVAVGVRDELSVFGDDYPTPDGTCIRDYIHVVDLAKAHVDALEALARDAKGVEAINIGTGHGTSVLEMVAASERAVGKPIPYRIAPRRPGDATIVYADPSLAKERIGWQAELDVDAMCVDHWRWQQQNPNGYRS